MINTEIDNRMSWIRNVDKLSKDNSDGYYVEYEIASECNIPGIFNYQDGMILTSFLTANRDRNNLYHYTLKIKYAGRILKEPSKYREVSSKGYYFKDGIVGELLAIFSLYFRCRFYLIAAYFGELSGDNIKTKAEYDFLCLPCSPHIHPPIFSNRNKNFAKGLDDFLDSIKSMDTKYHQQFILACYHYSRALKEIGIDGEMVFIRLVSSIEALCGFIKLNNKADLFEGRKFEDIIRSDVLSSKETKELQQIFETRKAGKKFIRFIELYSIGFFKGGKYRASHLKIKKSQLPKVLKTIYDARSSYLHNGEPMYLSQPGRKSYEWRWDTDPSLSTIIDNRRMSASRKLPYTYWFEELARHCILGFINKSSGNRETVML